MRKKNKSLAQARRAYNVLSSPIAKAMLPEGTFRSLAAEFLVSHPVENFERDLEKLYANSRFKKLFASSHIRIRDLDKGLSISGLPAKRAWQLCMFIIQEHRENLRRFIPRRLCVERLLLLGDCVKALEELEDVKECCGESFWYIRTKMLILSELRLTKELTEFCDSLEILKDRSFMDHMIHNARVLIDTDNPLAVLKNLIFSASNELKQANFDELASLFELLFAPQPLNEGVNFWLAIERIHAFPAVDQFILLEQITMLAMAETGISLTPCPVGSVNEVVNFLAKTIGAEVFTSPLSATREAKVTPHGKKILDLYESGCYEETITEFYENLIDLENPLAYVNLIAKSTVMLKRPSITETHRNGIIPDLVAQLVQIYGLEPNAVNAEEMLKSLAARYNSTRWCIHVQIAIFKALPWRCEGEARRIAARLALLTDREVTPLLSQIVESSQYLKELLPRNSCISTPDYRDTKRELIRLIQNDIFSDRCQSLLESLNGSDCLFKDKVEVRTLYLIKSEKYGELLQQSAEDLCRQPILHLVLPLARLVSVIESERIVSIPALVVLYFYNKFVSQKKDYVLNEIFDDYLYYEGVDRPSYILDRIEEVDDLSLVFFGQICVPDVLDYLSCFGNINELFAERIRILDTLSKRQLIDSDRRMLEVEDIVSRVVIETATSNLNGAKLAVDEAGLQKKVLPELQSLLSLFNENSGGNDDRFTIFPEDEKIGRQHGYISGARNAIILRICNLVMDAFLFDEKLGLDKTLSGEIRHGFFSNLMHARLEQAKLLAELDEGGRYRPNRHWREINQLVSSSFTERMESLLNNFGERLNSIIANAEEWMKIKQGNEGKDGVFEHELTKDDFDSIRAFVERDRTAELVCDFIFGILWGKVEQEASVIRDRLNGSFRAEVDGLFAKLESDLVLLKRNMALVELMNAISQARDGIKEDISTVAEWFRRAKSNVIQAGTLGNAVAIAINSFASVKGSDFAIRMELDSGLQEVPIQDVSVKPFILAFVNLLDNCYRHSGLWSRTQVSIRGSIVDEQSIIRVENDLSVEKAIGLNPEVMSGIENKIFNADSLNLIRTEGGSGLVKAYNALVGIGPTTRLHVETNQNSFAAVVYYGT
jgi:hypothetical protein